MKKGSKLLSILSTLLTAAFLLTGAIAVPILWRGFYYWQMDSLRLSYRSGFSPEVIREAFDQVMDFLVKGAPFGTGQLRWSQEGQAHFADCKARFQLDFLILAVCAVALLVLADLVHYVRNSIYRLCFRACLTSLNTPAGGSFAAMLR